jgi:TPR repeat protein
MHGYTEHMHTGVMHMGLPFLFTPESVAQDATVEVAWFRKVAKQGYTQAQCNLGEMYSQGKDMAQDASVAVAWY